MSRGRYFKEPCIIHDSAGIVAVLPCIYENMECYATLSDELDFAIYKAVSYTHLTLPTKA